MPGPSLRQHADLERACREVEATVSRVANVVLHASALADRMDPRVAADPHTASQRRERVRVLRDAVAAGRRTISGVGIAAASGGEGQHAVARP